MEVIKFTSEIGYRSGKKGLTGNRPTLILIHGAGGNAQIFLPQLRQLDRFLNVLALELPGHGKTPGPGRDKVSAYADWVQETLSQIQIDAYFLGGHSMGGAICQEMGLRYPKKIKGLILMATGARLEVNPKILTGLQDQPEETLIRICHWCYPKGTNPQIIEEAIQLMEQTPAPVILGDFQACNQFQRVEDIQQIRMPTLILVGEQDVMTPPAYSQYLHDNIPSSLLSIIPQTGHLVMLEKHKEVNDTIKDFVKTNS